MQNNDTILKQQSGEIKDIFLKPISENAGLQKRLYQEGNRYRADGEYQRDYTRILYAYALSQIPSALLSTVTYKPQLSYAAYTSFCFSK